MPKLESNEIDAKKMYIICFENSNTCMYIMWLKKIDIKYSWIFNFNIF